MAHPFDPTQRDAAPESEAIAQLAQVHGVRELHAAVLAMLLPPGHPQALRVWAQETGAAANAQPLRQSVGQLSGAARLPWFERLVSRMALHPLPARQALLSAARRMVAATGTTRPIDRLQWLAMRRLLGETAFLGGRGDAHADLSQLPDGDIDAIATFSAFLSRLVPHELPGPDGPAWYARVMAPWPERAAQPPRQPADADALVHALQVLQGFAWMQRPALMRGWVGAALAHSPGGRLRDGAADALRLSAALLDSPLPPELARHYIAPMPDSPR